MNFSNSHFWGKCDRNASPMASWIIYHKEGGEKKVVLFLIWICNYPLSQLWHSLHSWFSCFVLLTWSKGECEVPHPHTIGSFLHDLFVTMWKAKEFTRSLKLCHNMSYQQLAIPFGEPFGACFWNVIMLKKFFLTHLCWTLWTFMVYHVDERVWRNWKMVDG